MMSLRYTEGVAGLPCEYSSQPGQSDYWNSVFGRTLAKGNVILHEIRRDIGISPALERQK